MRAVQRHAFRLAVGFACGSLVWACAVEAGGKPNRSTARPSAAQKQTAAKPAPGAVPVRPLSATSGSLTERLGGMLAKLPHSSAVAGACVIDLDRNAVIFEYQADTPMVPASNMKVFAMAAALVELGENFAFRTVLASDGSNLLIIGDGDPAIGDEKLLAREGKSTRDTFDPWLDAVRHAGISSVTGDVIVDDSIFDAQAVHPSWDKDDLGKWYAAPVTGLTINDGCVDITIAPPKSGNGPLDVSIVPPTSLPKIINTARRGDGTPLLHHPAGSPEYRISGKTNKSYTFGPVPYPDPAMLLGDAFRTQLVSRSIPVGGQARRGRARLPDGSLPPNVRVLGEIRTPIADVLGRTGKDSQNLFAECLLKRAGYAHARRNGVAAQGSWEQGANAVRTFLEHVGVSPAGFVVADGSGLSRDNRCTARQLAATLAWLSRGPAGELFRDSLAVAGVDGSLKKRLKNDPGRVRGKTGTMRGIRTLSGFVDDSEGPRYAFAVMFNGYSGPSAPYKDIQDRMCQVLASAAP